MTVLWVRRRPGKEYSKGPNGERSIRQSYVAMCDNPDESLSAVLHCGMLPLYGAPHAEDYTLTCSRIRPNQNRDAPRLWDVEVEWTSSSPGGTSQEDKQKPPDQQRESWRDRFVAIPQTLPCDLDGKPFVDTAGTPFNPPPSQPIYVQEITVQRYEASRSITLDRSYLNATNTDTWLSAKAGEALVANIETEEVWLQNRWWLRRTYQIYVCPFVTLGGNAGEWGGYDPFWLIDAGPKVLDANGKPQPAKDGEYVDGQAVLLDGHGKRLEKVDGVLVPVKLSFRTVKKRTYAPLNLAPPY